MPLHCRQFPYSDKEFPKVFDDIPSCLHARNQIRCKRSSNKVFPSYTQSFYTIALQSELDDFISQITKSKPRTVSLSKKETSQLLPKETLKSINALKPSLGTYSCDMESVASTLRYVFKFHKKGIYVQIRDGKLTYFVPFSNTQYKNQLSQPDVRKASKLFENNIKKECWLKDPQQWYVDGCLIKPKQNWYCNTPDWYYAEYWYLLTLLLKKYKKKVNDIDFIINVANFPLFFCEHCEDNKKRTWYHPHEEIKNTIHGKAPGHLQTAVPCPVFSSFKRAYHNDILIPSGYDVAMASKKVFIGTASKTSGCSSMFPDMNDKLQFHEKNDKIIWRGGLSNCGGTRTTSCRYKVASLKGCDSFLDAKVTDAGLDTVRKSFNKPISRTDQPSPDEIGPSIGREEFLKYKYILMLGGTNTNASLPYFFNSNSIVLFGGDKGYIMWYNHALKKDKQYIRIDCEKNNEELSKDLRQVVERTKTKQGVEKMKLMNKNARTFYNTYININFMVDYMFWLINNTTNYNQGS
jgi:hypothetical protein